MKRHPPRLRLVQPKAKPRKSAHQSLADVMPIARIKTTDDHVIAIPKQRGFTGPSNHWSIT
jgi:hypothetical protein